MASITPLTQYGSHRHGMLFHKDGSNRHDLGQYSSIDYNLDDDDRTMQGRCPHVPDGYCAVLYDDENCEGWSQKIPTGSYDLPKELRNDAEVVVVRKGCKFTGTTLANIFFLHKSIATKPTSMSHAGVYP